jgi:L-lactate dehydrogenase complex protein LldG
VRDDAAPATFSDVAVAVLFGSLAVAENGAVALSGAHARVRALPFLCERLVLLVEAGSVVPDMHAAVERLPDDATAHHHYTWISGPSKTADIEQALVLGAHGPRACTVVAFD